MSVEEIPRPNMMPKPIVNTANEEEKSNYIRYRKEMMQERIVNIRNSTTSILDVTSWTFRTTSSDVFSMVTTTVPIKNGHMKDIKIRNKEMKRLVFT